MLPRIGQSGFFFPQTPLECGGLETTNGAVVAKVVGINDDDTLNLIVWDRRGFYCTVHNVPSEENASDYVHFFRVDGLGIDIPKKPLESRNPDWQQLRKMYIALHPVCEFCGRAAEEVHHITPVSIDPTQELDFENLLSLCHQHHFDIGHLGRWKTWNPCVVDDCERHRSMMHTGPSSVADSLAFFDVYHLTGPTPDA